jgi:hypothetical protein
MLTVVDKGVMDCMLLETQPTKHHHCIIQFISSFLHLVDQIFIGVVVGGGGRNYMLH